MNDHVYRIRQIYIGFHNTKELRRKFLRVLVLLFIMYSSVVTLKADNLSKHYIFAFDLTIHQKYDRDFTSLRVINILDSLLNHNGFDKSKDYVSVVFYTLDLSNPDMNNFVKPCKLDGMPLLRKQIGEKRLSKLLSDWPYYQPKHGAYASMQSLCKPYAVMETKTSDTTAYVDKTILLIISDQKVNGTDDNYDLEWDRVSKLPLANIPRFNSIKPEASKTWTAFNEDFKFSRSKLKYGNREIDEVYISADGVYRIVPYEVKTADAPSIHSVTDLPSPLPMKRVRGGFMVNATPHSLNEKYNISHVEINDARGNLLAQSDDGSLDVLLKSKQIKVGDTICVKMSLRFNDGLYDGVIISSENPRFKEGMTIKQAIKLQDEAKVMGLLPLSDFFWWWFPNDVFTAVMIWDLIFLLALIALIGYILYKLFVKINSYIPSNENIKIKKI